MTRITRYITHYGLINTLILPAIIAVISYKSQSNIKLVVPISILSFLITAPFAKWFIFQIGSPLMDFVDKRLLLSTIIISLIINTAFSQELGLLVASCIVSFYAGITFWTRTGEMYELTSWLAHGLEYGNPPDDIQLVLKEKVLWREYSETCYLFKYTYGGIVGYAITGPITFSLMDSFGDSTPHDILQKYKEWYLKENIKKVLTPETKS